MFTEFSSLTDLKAETQSLKKLTKIKCPLLTLKVQKKNCREIMGSKPKKFENGDHSEDNALLGLIQKLVKRSCGFHYGEDNTR